MRISTVIVALAAVSVSARPIGADYDHLLLQQRDSGLQLDKRGIFSDWWDSLWKPAGESSSSSSGSSDSSSTSTASSSDSSSSSSSSDSSSESLTSILSTFSSWLNNLLDSAGAGASNSGSSNSGSSNTPEASPSVAPPVSPSAAPKKPAPTLAPINPNKLPDLDSWDQIMLVTQNAKRAQHDVGAFIWNTTLAQYASDYLDKAQCNFEHSHGPYGENLAIGYPTPQAAVDAWYDEFKDYNYAQGDFSEATGHFTQLVWKGSQQVGCAQKDCGPSRGSYVVCEYYPRGNIIGRFTQNVFN